MLRCGAHEKHTQSPIHTLTHRYTYKLTHRLTHTEKHTTLTHTQAHSNIHTLGDTHTQPHSHRHTHTHTETYNRWFKMTKQGHRIVVLGHKKSYVTSSVLQCSKDKETVSKLWPVKSECSTNMNLLAIASIKVNHLMPKHVTKKAHANIRHREKTKHLLMPIRIHVENLSEKFADFSFGRI